MGKIRIHYGNVATLRDGLRQALYKTADAIRTDVRDKQVIPFDKGTLQENTFIDDTRNPDNAYVVHPLHTLVGFIFIRNTTSVQKTMSMQVVNGLNRGPLKANMQGWVKKTI